MSRGKPKPAFFHDFVIRVFSWEKGETSIETDTDDKITAPLLIK